MNAVAKVLLECLRQNSKPHKAFETKASPCLRAAKRASRKVSLRAANNPQRSCAQPNPEVCGKIQWCRPHRIATTLLPAVFLRQKGGVLEGSDICRILPAGVSRSAGKNRDLPTRPRIYASVTCGFVAKNRVVLGALRFSPHFRKTPQKRRALKQKSRQMPRRKQPFKHGNSLLSVPANQSGSTAQPQ